MLPTMVKGTGFWAGLWLLLSVPMALVLRFVAGASWSDVVAYGPLCTTCAWSVVVASQVRDRWKQRRRTAQAEAVDVLPVPVFPKELPRAPRPLSGELGRTPFTLEPQGGRTVLRVGDWTTVIGPDTRVRHVSHLLWKTFSVGQPGRPEFVLRYRLPWRLQLFGWTEPDYLVAEMDDPGLELAAELGGDTGWVLADPVRG